jgi:transposase
MDIVGGFDVHRKQITFDYVEIETGESHLGEIRPADREHLRSWLEQFAQRLCGREAAFALEATTGWRYVVEELGRVGVEAHLAEPADTKALQGRKKRAKTDRIDARHLRELLLIDRLPESWIPPEHVQEIRTLMRIRHTMSSRSAPPTSNVFTPSSSTMDVPRRRTCSRPKGSSVCSRWGFRGLPARSRTSA